LFRKTDNRRRIGSLALMLPVLSLLALSVVPAAYAAGAPFTPGQVIAGTGGGTETQLNPTTGATVGTLATTTGSSEDTGMCFLLDGSLLTTNWPSSTFGISQFSTAGALLHATWNKSPITTHGESCVVDASGNVYVGQTDGSFISKWAPDGTFIKSWAVAADTRGADWIDLAANQCTIYYNGEGSAIARFDVCANGGAGMQLTAFPGVEVGPCFALRIMPNGNVMSACSGAVYRFDSSGTLLKACPSPNSDSLFAMNLDPDGTSFWTAGYSSGHVYHINILTAPSSRTSDRYPSPRA